jgi:AraC-like DNA-binding protein
VEVAAAAHLSENQFSSLFHSIVGLNVQQYILQCRLRFAKQLLSLRGEQYPICDVAAESGFSDQAHFSRQFRSLFRPDTGRIPTSVHLDKKTVPTFYQAWGKWG